MQFNDVCGSNTEYEGDNGSVVCIVYNTDEKDSFETYADAWNTFSKIAKKKNVTDVYIQSYGCE